MKLVAGKSAELLALGAGFAAACLGAGLTFAMIIRLQNPFPDGVSLAKLGEFIQGGGMLACLVALVGCLPYVVLRMGLSLLRRRDLASFALAGAILGLGLIVSHAVEDPEGPSSLVDWLDLRVLLASAVGAVGGTLAWVAEGQVRRLAKPAGGAT